jgi:glutathione S-transferase
MIVVHHLNNSRSQRILWLLEELGLEYEIKKYRRDAKTMLAPPELRAVHPPQIRQHLAFLEGELGKRTWFAGDDFSAADIQMSFPLEAAAARGGLDGQYPYLVAFLDKIHARPAYRRALERGGQYDFVK